MHDVNISFLAATGYSTDKPNLHTAVDRRSGGDTVGNLGSNATSPA